MDDPQSDERTAKDSLPAVHEDRFRALGLVPLAEFEARKVAITPEQARQKPTDSSASAIAGG